MHFGRKVTGDAEYERAAKNEAGGGHIFGSRVRDAIPESGPTNLAKRNSQFGVNVLDDVTPANNKGEEASVSLDDLKNILAENPTFLDSLYEAELAREGGPRDEALDLFYEVERGIKGQMRADVMAEIRTLRGQNEIDAEQLQNEMDARREVTKKERALAADNALLADAPRLKALKEREENLAAVKESGAEQASGLSIEQKIRQIAERDGKSLPGEGASAAGGVSTKPDGPVHAETQQPGERLGVPKGATTANEDASTSSDEAPDFESYTKAELEAFVGDVDVKGTGSDGAVLKADLVKAAKKLHKQGK